MVLSNELISSLVKLTKDKPSVKSDSGLFATVVKYNGEDYVKLDGSEVMTPVISTTEVKEDDRVLVDIKDHTAIVTGNITDPAASGTKVKEVGDQISDFEIVIADKVNTEELNAQIGRIDQLVSDNVVIRDSLTASKADISDLQADYVTVSGKLTAVEAEIKVLDTEKITAEQADLKYATIENLNATNADIYNLEATYGYFEVLATNKFNAIDATIENLDATYATITDVSIERARIDDLEANQADIDSLTSEVADINTLIFGSATGNVIQSSFANAVVAQLGNAQIKSAMIESLSADKITAGDIITNNVRVMSEDGSLIISDETMQISDENRVRVQIGKDTSGDYSINVWDANGKLMFSEGGITDNAIKTAIIRNDMVSDSANISAHKLDINSLFTVINEDGTNTIKASQIYLDDEQQRLDLAFTEMSGDVSSQGTQLSVVQGQISSKIWQQDIDIVADDVETLTTKYSALDQTMDSVLVTVASHTSELEDKADKTSVTAVEDTVSKLEVNLTGFQTTVSNTYATKIEVKDSIDDIEVGGKNLIRNSNFANGKNYWIISQVNAEVITDDTFDQCLKFSAETADSDHRIYPDTVGNFSHASQKEYTLSFWAKADEETSIQSNVAINNNIVSHQLTTEWKKYAITYTTTTYGSLTFRPNYAGVAIYLANVKLELGNKATDWTPAPEDLVTEVTLAKTEAKITQNANSITAAVNRISTNEKSISTLTQTADGLTSKVTKAQNDIDSLEVGGRNLIVLSSLQDGYRMETNGEGYNSALSSLTSDILVRPGEELTYTVYGVHTDDGDTYFQLSFFTEDGTFISRPVMSQATTTKEKTSWTVSIPENAVTAKAAFPTSIKDKIKLEYGNKATDWTPAPEDLGTIVDVDNAQSTADSAIARVTDAESLIQQLANEITTIVTSGEASSIMTQTENGWVFNISGITDNLNRVSEGLDSLVNEVGDTNSAVSVLEQAVNDLGVLANYVKITTDGEQPCIELGTGNSDFKLLITNTDIRFMEGSSVIAYINNQTLHITKAIIEEELQQGKFVWKVRSNGNLGLQWKGGNG